jgi:hypothetical protein
LPGEAAPGQAPATAKSTADFPLPIDADGEAYREAQRTPLANLQILLVHQRKVGDVLDLQGAGLAYAAGWANSSARQGD